ncbi:unnamed protein product, partial [marine sediment metagenome]
RLRIFMSPPYEQAGEACPPPAPQARSGARLLLPDDPASSTTPGNGHVHTANPSTAESILPSLGP